MVRVDADTLTELNAVAPAQPLNRRCVSECGVSFLSQYVTSTCSKLGLIVSSAARARNLTPDDEVWNQVNGVRRAFVP